MNPIGRPHVGEKELLASDQVQWYYLILAVLLVSVFLIVRLHGSRLGRAWMAMREDEAAAASMGIDLVKTKLLAFALGASFSGFAGSMYASMLQFIDPFQFDFSISVIVLSMVILGGIGNVWGVMVGAVVMGIFNFIVTDAATPWIRAFGSLINVPVVSPWLQGVDLSSAKLLMFGLVLVLLMAIRPQGLFPSMQRRSELLEADPTAPVPPTTMEPVGATRTH
jgi:branched-chain amino acid transport system permease protein